MIEDYENQGGASAAAGAPRAKPQPDQGPRPGQPGAAAPPDDPDSAPIPGSSEAIQRVWGHLEERLRQQMRTAGVESFLPEYEAMIEAYYKRLDERPLNGP